VMIEGGAAWVTGAAVEWVSLDVAGTAGGGTTWIGRRTGGSFPGSSDTVVAVWIDPVASRVEGGLKSIVATSSALISTTLAPRWTEKRR